MDSILFEQVSKVYADASTRRWKIPFWRKAREALGEQERYALHNVSFHIQQGEIFGLLGPNGAGKTTTVNIITGLLAKDSGTVRVQGHDPVADWKSVRQIIGVVPQETAVYPELSAVQNLEFHAALYVKNMRNIRAKIDEILELVELTARCHDAVGTYSGGMKRRLAIGRALLHDPQILLLDEPTLGVDVQGTHRIWEYIKCLASSGKTILVTTNVMAEADFLCDRILILDHGKTIATDSPAALKKTLGNSQIVITTPEPLPQATLADLIPLPFEVQERIVRIAAEHGNADLVRLLPQLSTNLQITTLEMKTPTLDDVLLHYTGRSLRD
jgi:ABC-2 type transport system ATP-binding protein